METNIIISVSIVSAKKMPKIQNTLISALDVNYLRKEYPSPASIKSALAEWDLIEILVKKCFENLYFNPILL